MRLRHVDFISREFNQVTTAWLWLISIDPVFNMLGLVAGQGAR